MKLSTAFWQTYKEVPADAEIPSHILMMRAGLIHKAAAGLYSYLPMGYRSIRKAEQIVREEMNKAGCHELLMPVVTPGELWQETGRWDVMGDEMLKFKDKGRRDLCISPTNEEAITDIFRKTIKSYKQLPVTLYQINTKFRDEIRPRFGLMRGREFTMKDAYSFHLDKRCLDRVYDGLYQAYSNCFTRMGLKFIAVEADAGNMGSSDSKTHEFQVIADAGEDQIAWCEANGYAANLEKAQTKRAKNDSDKTHTTIKEIPTPGKATIEEVCTFLNRPEHHSLKSLVYSAIKNDKEEVVLIQLLGDDTLNEVKLKNYLGASHLVAASEDTLSKLNLPKGYIGPYGLSTKLRLLIDTSVDPKGAYVVGALKKDFHLEGVVPERDLKDIEWVDLRLAKEGDLSLDGKGEIRLRRGIEVGHIFQLGDKYTKGMGATVLDQNGKAQTPLMGCYGIGITRVVAAAIEQHHDEKGIIWPKALAPYHIYLTSVGKDAAIFEIAAKLYTDLSAAGFEVIFDDRNAGPGVKFNDADLLGLPLRIVVGERDYKESGVIEVVERRGFVKHLIAEADLLATVKKLWENLA
jgi:prolyl-tRNA synthetase